MNHYEELKMIARDSGIGRYVVGIVVPDGGRVLLLQRKADDFMPNIYEFPGGKVEPGESLPDAIRRELLEETGMTLKGIKKYLGHFEYATAYGTVTRQFNFVVDADTPGRIVHPEHQAFAWVERADLDRYNITPETKGVIRAHFKGAAIRNL